MVTFKIPPLYLDVLIVSSFLLFHLCAHAYANSGLPESSDRNEKGHTAQMRTDIRDNLEKNVRFLAEDIGPRAYLQTDALNRASDHIVSEFERYGYDVQYQRYEVNGREYRNVYVKKTGVLHPEKVLVVGAHYDTVIGTPGADDNASAVAGVLELSRQLRNVPLQKTIHFIAFTLEEPPFFRSSLMGSHKYAEKLNKEDIEVEGMICLESIGFFADTPESQLFPLAFFRFIYPTTGTFIIFAGDLGSRTFLGRAKEGFEMGTDLPIETISAPSMIPGIDFSDHRSFWKFGYDAFMVTDTAFYRNPNYHTAGDVPDTLDFDRMAEVVLGLRSSIEHLAGN